MVELIERRIGEQFEYVGNVLRVDYAGDQSSCDGCFFSGRLKCCRHEIHVVRGACSTAREDGTNVVFSLVQKATPMAEEKNSAIPAALPDSWLSVISAALSRVCGVSRGKIKRIRKKILRKNKESV